VADGRDMGNKNEGRHMTIQHIPPIQCLITFEAVARLRNAGRAADELCVTPSAVSHRLRQLESHVGFKLFGRADFTLTADGAAYLANVRVGLAALQPSPNKRHSRRVTRLRVAVTPTFCRQFLMPKLEIFRNNYPDIDLVLQVSIPLLNVTAEEADLEVRFGVGGYADIEHRLILSDEVTPAEAEMNEAILARVEELGGGYVWDAEVFAVTLIDVAITDSDAMALSGLTGVQQIALDSSNVSTGVLNKIAAIAGLQSLVVCNPAFNAGDLEQLQVVGPEVQVVEE
jgi:DNA-binding transcriptional LysR family regulator